MKPVYTIILLILLGNPLQNSQAESTPDIGLNIAGTQHTLSDFKGKIVYLDFWASWCIPCRKSFPFMNQIHARYKDKGLEIIAINLDTDITMVRKFLQQYPAEFKISYDSAGITAETFIIKAMPTSFLINRNGEVIATHAGFRQQDAEKIEKLIQSNL